MGFFEEFGTLMKKYNLQLHTIQLDENVAKFNEVFNTNIKKEDLPPPVMLFRTSEGDFIPTVFGPIAAKNPDVKFINIANPTKVIDLFPPEVEKGDDRQVDLEEVRKAEAAQDGETPPTKKMLVVGALFGKENFNAEQYTKFVDENLGKLSIYNTLTNLLQLAIGQKNYAENEAIKANSKRGREVVETLLKFVKDFDKLILLKGWNKALEARKIVEFAKENNIEVVEQQDF